MGDDSCLFEELERRLSKRIFGGGLPKALPVHLVGLGPYFFYRKLVFAHGTSLRPSELCGYPE